MKKKEFKKLLIPKNKAQKIFSTWKDEPKENIKLLELFKWLVIVNKSTINI